MIRARLGPAVVGLSRDEDEVVAPVPLADLPTV